MTGAVPSRTSAAARREPRPDRLRRGRSPRGRCGSRPSRPARHRAPRARRGPRRSSRGGPGWRAVQPVTWLASACEPASCDCRCSAAPNSSSASWRRPRPACSIPAAMVQQQPDARPGVCLQGPSGALQPSLAFVELTRQDHRGGQRHQRGRDHRLRAPAVPLGERYRLAAAPLGRGERAAGSATRNRAAPGSRPRGRAGRSPGPGRRPPGGGVRRPASPSDHASTIPRFISATARRSLPSAMSSSDCPVTGEARNLACSMTPAR